MKLTVYHNPRCSKSRCALDFLNEKGVEYEIIDYLKDSPTKKELKEIIKKLGIKAEDLIRKSEEVFKNNFAGKTLSESQWLDAMVKFPKLIERPIVIKDQKAIIARPTEKILDLI